MNPQHKDTGYHSTSESLNKYKIVQISWLDWYSLTWLLRRLVGRERGKFKYSEDRRGVVDAVEPRDWSEKRGRT